MKDKKDTISEVILKSNLKCIWTYAALYFLINTIFSIFVKGNKDFYGMVISILLLLIIGCFIYIFMLYKTLKCINQEIKSELENTLKSKLSYEMNNHNMVLKTIMEQTQYRKNDLSKEHCNIVDVIKENNQYDYNILTKQDYMSKDINQISKKLDDIFSLLKMLKWEIEYKEITENEK